MPSLLDALEREMVVATLGNLPMPDRIVDAISDSLPTGESQEIFRTLLVDGDSALVSRREQYSFLRSVVRARERYPDLDLRLLGPRLAHSILVAPRYGVIHVVARPWRIAIERAALLFERKIRGGDVTEEERRTISIVAQSFRPLTLDSRSEWGLDAAASAVLGSYSLALEEAAWARGALSNRRLSAVWRAHVQRFLQLLNGEP